MSIDAEARGDNSQACPACGATERDLLGEKNGCRLHRCGECKTLYAERSPLNYEDYYDAHNLVVPEFIRARLDELFAGLNSWRQSNRLLDIGCGAGSLLEAAKRAHWEAEGLEVSQPAAAHVRSLGFKVFCGDLSQANYPSDYFDIVMASELIEHLEQPLEMLKETARILRPGGLLWATTPNGGGLSCRLLATEWSTVSPPEHLQLFTVDGIRRLMRRAGFREASVASRSLNPAEIWHAWRRAPQNGSGAVNGSHTKVTDAESVKAKSFDRVASSYRLNEAMVRNGLTRSVKAAANTMLRLTGLGDSIRIEAIK